MKFARRSELHQPRPRQTAKVLHETVEDNELRFDPQKEISMDDREKIVRQALKVNWVWNLYCKEASTFLTMFPQERDAIDLDKNMKGIVEAMRHNVKKKEPAGELATMAKAFIQLFPDQREWLLRDESIMNKLRTLLNKMPQAGTDQFLFPERFPESYSEWAEQMEIIFPDEREKLKLGEMKASLFAALHHARAQSNWIGFSRIARYIMILFPDAREELQLDSKAWNNMRVIFNGTCTEPLWGEISSEMAESMYILSHQRAEITAEGQLQLTPFPQKFRKSQPMPRRSHLAQS